MCGPSATGKKCAAQVQTRRKCAAQVQTEKKFRPKCKRTFKRNQFQQLSKKVLKKGVNFRGVSFCEKVPKLVAKIFSFY